jgi:DNA-binding NarL/FixJ family response regulator
MKNIMKANYKRTFYILFPNNQEPPLFYYLVASRFGRLTQIRSEELISLNSADRHKILLFDYQHKDRVLPYLNAFEINLQQVETVVINVSKRLQTEELLSFGNLKGLFYHNNSIEKVVAGLKKIRQGQNALPQHVTSQLLHYYRHLFQNHNLSATVSLTTRELEILRCLQTGTTNTQIADNLFISEYTVKSHLYQIFKKISVKNRAQAVAWAKQNLTS